MDASEHLGRKPAAGAVRLGPSFADRLAVLHASLRRAGLPVADMRRAEALELRFAGSLDRAPGQPAAPGEIVRIEDRPIAPRPVPPAPPGSSRIRYFLDGTQRTFLVYRAGLIPIVGTVVAAAILARDGEGNVRLLPERLLLDHAILAPREAADPDLRRVVAEAEALGLRVVDPVAAALEAERERRCPADRAAHYARCCGDYGHLVEAAYRMARELRADLELQLLDAWANRPAPDDGWLVVDGRLRLAVPNALGLVKNLQGQDLVGAEAVVPLALPPGHRTSAFRAPGDRRRSGGRRLNLVSAEATEDNAPTLWYLRLRDAEGQDARHALIRVETAPAVAATDEIDRLSGWLLVERTPRATGDERWATLLYPIHLLERLLKRRLQVDTFGWPAAR